MISSLAFGETMTPPMIRAVLLPRHLRSRVARKRQHDLPGLHLPGIHIGLADADRREFGVGEDVRGDGLEAQRRDSLAQRVPHRDPALHGGDAGERKHPRAVARGVDALHVGATDPVDGDVPARRHRDSVFSEAEVGGVGDRADRHQAVRSGDRLAAGKLNGDGVAGSAYGGGSGVVHDLHAAAAEDPLDRHGGVRVLVRHHAVAARYKRDRYAHRKVSRGELGTGDAGADHDQVLGEGRQVIDLAPGEDALAVGDRVGQLPGCRAGRDQDCGGID